MDHELLRALLLHGEVAFENDDYEGITRDDDHFEAGLGARYMLGRHYALRGDWRFDRRDSNVAGQDFSRHVFTLRLELQY